MERLGMTALPGCLRGRIQEFGKTWETRPVKGKTFPLFRAGGKRGESWVELPAWPDSLWASPSVAGIYLSSFLNPSSEGSRGNLRSGLPSARNSPSAVVSSSSVGIGAILAPQRVCCHRSSRPLSLRSLCCEVLDRPHTISWCDTLLRCGRRIIGRRWPEDS